MQDPGWWRSLPTNDAYQAAFRNSMEPLLLTTPDGRVLMANRACEELLGYGEEELRSLGRAAVVDPSDARLEHALATRRRTGRFTGTLTLKRKTGERFEAEVSSLIFAGHDGRPLTTMHIRRVPKEARGGFDAAGSDSVGHIAQATPRRPIRETLHTARLRLRPVTLDDAPAVYAMAAIPQVGRASRWPAALTVDGVRALIHGIIGQAREGLAMMWIVEDRATHAMLGDIRLDYVDVAWNCGGLGFDLRPSHWGRGLMTEAARAVVRFGHESLGLHRIEAWTVAANPGSERVLHKCGFAYEGTLRGRGRFSDRFEDLRWFGRLSTDALPRAAPVPSAENSRD